MARLRFASVPGRACVLARASFTILLSERYVEDEGIEPSTLGLQSQCSPAELIPQPRESCVRFSVRRDGVSPFAGGPLPSAGSAAAESASQNQIADVQSVEFHVVPVVPPCSCEPGWRGNTNRRCLISR